MDEVLAALPARPGGAPAARRARAAPATSPAAPAAATSLRRERRPRAGLGTSNSSWLIGDGMDRERMLDMDRLVAPVRRRSFLVMAACLIGCGPWFGWWTLIPLAVAGALFALADWALERVTHPEYLLFTAWTASQ